MTDRSKGPSRREVPDGDTIERLVCPECGFIAYENPKVVVGAVAVWEGRILLCRRAIRPSRGLWTLPAGYLELNETTAEGAMREAWEEARARLDLKAVLGLYNIPRISQVQVIYLADLLSPDVEAGPESEEVALFGWEDIPWDEIAFPSVRWALDHYEEVKGEESFAPRGNPPGDLGDME
jgi:ADP-ribose pyrophosphatase YjhB (NUDIX family)